MTTRFDMAAGWIVGAIIVAISGHMNMGNAFAAVAFPSCLLLVWAGERIADAWWSWWRPPGVMWDEWRTAVVRVVERDREER